MVSFYSDDNVTLDFRVVRAFKTSEAVAEQYGILANFSAKTVLVTKDSETELMSHNALMITRRDGKLAISSSSKKDSWNNSQGQRVDGPRVYFTTLFPGDGFSTNSDNYQQFVTKLVHEMKQFIEEKKQEAAAAKNEQPVLPF